MKKAISEVLEKMFFLMVDFDDLPSLSKEYPYECGIYLHREKDSIRVRLRVSAAFAQMITANLLGMREEDTTPQDMEDTLKEWANMVAGNFQHLMGGTEWRLGIPYFKMVSESPDPKEDGIFFSSLGEEMAMVFLEKTGGKDEIGLYPNAGK